MLFNEEGLQLLKEFEGCRLTAYRDLRGIASIGYGDTHDVTMGMTITQEEANGRLSQQADAMGNDVVKLLSRELNDNEFSAVVCLAYNIGPGNLSKSQVLRAINQGDDPTPEWLLWDKVNGEEVPGLLRRREAELNLYFLKVVVEAEVLLA